MYMMPAAPGSWDFESGPFASTQVAPNARLGVGFFGLKRERSGMGAATVREVNAPKTRRAAIGFSLKF
jgi:hypothetical protein